ncbi:MAG: coenzyme A pyrophosphatase [Cyclobacteriaceae bacterium]|nr:MAG: coenzyme A pyrophosphatase [Cyclobacteriaceae bacterium]
MSKKFIGKLKARLQAPLPGVTAQNKMRASRAGGQAISFSHKGAPRQGGVAIVLYQEQDKWYFPLIKRTEYPGIHSGQISLPGGKKEKEDYDLIGTAIREANEELGLDLVPHHIIGSLTELYIIASHFNILPVVAVLNSPPDFKPDPREVHQVVPLMVDQLLNPDTKQIKDIEVRGIDIRAPYFKVDGQVVWGATAMILNEFLTVLSEIDYH